MRHTILALLAAAVLSMAITPSYAAKSRKEISLSGKPFNFTKKADRDRFWDERVQGANGGG